MDDAINTFEINPAGCAVSEVFRVGDVFTIPVTTRRKWWQFWKPHSSRVLGKFIVQSVHVGTITIDDRG